MHLLAHEEYGLRCLLQVAFHEGKAPVTIPEIADREGLSPEYTAKLLRTLRLGDLVSSTRGASGGYRLARPAESITVWEALGALGGDFFPEGFCDCHPGKRASCVHSTDCSIRAVWRAAERSLRETLGAITLRDLRRDERSMEIFLGGDSNKPSWTRPV